VSAERWVRQVDAGLHEFETVWGELVDEQEQAVKAGDTEKAARLAEVGAKLRSAVELLAEAREEMRWGKP
jgi:hypothetical protein